MKSGNRKMKIRYYKINKINETKNMIWPREIVCYRHCLNPAPFGTVDISMYSKMYIAWFVELIFHFCSLLYFFLSLSFSFLGLLAVFLTLAAYLHHQNIFILRHVSCLISFCTGSSFWAFNSEFKRHIFGYFRLFKNFVGFVCFYNISHYPYLGTGGISAWFGGICVIFLPFCVFFLSLVSLSQVALPLPWHWRHICCIWLGR